MSQQKVFAKSEYRYRASAKERRLYGGVTVTQFLVGFEGSAPGTWKRIMGYGPTPGQRKTDAIRKFLAEETRSNPMRPSHWYVEDGSGNILFTARTKGAADRTAQRRRRQGVRGVVVKPYYTASQQAKMARGNPGKPLKLWEFNDVHAHWNFVREVDEQDKDEWLATLRRIEPNTVFVVKSIKPTLPPEGSRWHSFRGYQRINPGLIHGSRALGAAMHHWHSSQGDPIYGVGSMFYAGKGADEEQVERAITEFERLYRDRARYGWGAATELRKIISALKYALRK